MECTRYTTPFALFLLVSHFITSYKNKMKWSDLWHTYINFMGFNIRYSDKVKWSDLWHTFFNFMGFITLFRDKVKWSDLWHAFFWQSGV